MTKLGRKNSLNIDIEKHFNELTEFNQKAILYTFDSNCFEELIKNNKKHAVRNFILQLILFLNKQETE